MSLIKLQTRFLGCCVGLLIVMAAMEGHLVDALVIMAAGIITGVILLRKP